MDATQKMLQGIINGQSAMKSELLTKIDVLDKKLSLKIDNLDIKIDKVDKKLTNRIDKLGRQLAYLDDDAPTREEHDDLVNRVVKLEQKVSSV